MMNTLKKYILLLTIIMPFCLEAKNEPASLSCSKNGLSIFYINGIGSLEESSNYQARESFAAASEVNTKLDNKINLHNEGLIVNTMGTYFEDLYKLIRMKATELGQEDSWQEKASRYIFTTKAFCLADPVICKLTEAEMLKLKQKQDFVTQFDIKVGVSRIKDALNVGKKVIVVSHSQGNLVANRIYENLKNSGLQEKLDKYYGNLQVGSVAKSIASKNGLNYTFQQDYSVQGLRLLFPLSQIMFGDYRVDQSPIPTGDLLQNHSFIDYYVSPQVSTRSMAPGRAAQFRSAREHFHLRLEELAWKLANNDESCCEGKDGRFFRKDITSEVQEGFVENSVSVTNADIQMDHASQICGKVSVGDKNSDTHLMMEGSGILGVEKIEVKGNLFLVDSEISPYDSNDTLVINGTHDLPIYIERSVIYGSPKIVGSMIISDVQMVGGNQVLGTPFNHNGMDHQPMIFETTVMNNFHLAGHYYINRPISLSYITGSPVSTSATSFNTMTISNHEDGIYEGELDGIAFVGGKLESSVSIYGFVVSGNKDGININSGTTVLADASIQGGAVLSGGAKFSGNWAGNSLTPMGFISHISGEVGVVASAINGAATIFCSNIVNGTFLGNPSLTNVTQTGCSYLGNAIVRGESGACGTYGSGYVSPTVASCTKNGEDAYRSTLEEKEEIQEKYKQIALEKTTLMLSKFN